LLCRITKNATPRMAWLHAETKRLLAEHGKVRRLGDHLVFVSPTGHRYRYEKVFNAACEAAGIEGFCFHHLRHSATTYLTREGASEQQLKAIGAWTSGVVSRYVHLAAMETRDIVQKMNETILGNR
jgi:integrase